MTVTEPSTDEQRSEIRLFDVAAIFFVSMITGAIGFSAGTAIGGAGSYAETCGGLIGLWAGLIPGTLLILRIRETGNLVKDLNLRFKLPTDLQGILYGLGSQFILLPLLYVVVQWFVSNDLTEQLKKPAEDLTGNAHGAGFFFMAVLLVIGAPVVEEIFYRGMLLRSLKRYLPVWPAILVDGFLFGLVHFDLVTLPGLALFGVILAWLSHRSGRLGPNILAHATFNAATVLVLWKG
jgi:membrane protease YdiL (CAAX protease family)